MEVSEILNAAADYLMTHYWFGFGTPRDGYVPDDAACVGQAMDRCGANGGSAAAAPAFLNFLGVEYDPNNPVWGLIHWNDEVAESKEQVIAALRGAAEFVRAGD